MRVLLVNPTRKYNYPFGKHSVFPNSLLFLAAVLERHGHEVQILDNQVDAREPKDFISFAPAVVGFSVLTGPNIADAIAQSREFKGINPKTKIVWGNVHPSVLPNQTLSEPYIDHVVIGAGEYTLLELVQHLEKGYPELAQIKGLAYKKDGKIFINEPRPFIKNLDELPDPAWHLIDVAAYMEKSLNTSRGCPFHCTFCYSPLFYKGYSGDLSAERIVSQIEHLKGAYGITFIRFFEDNFTHNRKRLREFCELLISKKLNFKWDCDSRAGLDADVISLMAKSGCLSVGLGVESGSPRMLKFIRKGTTIEAIEKTIRLLVKHNIMPRLYFIAELPTETIEDFKMTQELIRRLDSPPYQYMPYMPFPGTALFNYCVTEGLVDPPKMLYDWSNISILSTINPNYINVPRKMIDGAMANLKRMYFLRPLRFSLKHMPFYFLTLTPTPIELFRGVRSFINYYLTRPVCRTHARGNFNVAK